MRDSLLSQFETHHRQQRELFLKRCSTRQQKVLQLLPLLFHINHPSLPGYQGENCPAGLSMYQPDKAIALQSKQLFQGFHYHPKAQHVYRLKGLYLLPKYGLLDAGDPANQSFDIWVIYQADLAAEIIQKLQQKMMAICVWADTVGCQINGFITSESDLVHQPNIQSNLEHFYCYGLILAGLLPQFWFEAENRAEPTFHKGTLSFGDPPPLTAQACFNQAFKAWQNAWHFTADGLLKHAFHQQQLQRFPDCLSLADRRRSQIALLDNSNPYLLDPLTLMFDQLTAVTLPESINSLFYQVCDETLSKQVRYPTQPLKRAFTENYVKQWGWSDLQRRQADLPETHHYRQRLALLPMYYQWQKTTLQTLQSFAKQHDLPEQQRLQWARKYYAEKLFPPESALQALPKIFQLTEGFDQLYLYRFTDNTHWYLSDIAMAAPNDAALHQHHALLALLSIAITNGLLVNNTALRVVDHQHIVTATQANQLYTLLRQQLSAIEVMPDNMFIHSEDRAQRLLIFVNYPKDDPLPERSVKPFISSRKNDPLRYSSAELNLVQQLEVLIQTEQGQWHYLTQQGDQATIELLTTLLRWPFDERLIKHLSLYCATPLYGGAITARLQQLISAVLRHKYQFPEAGRFYLKTAQALWQIQWHNDQLASQLLPKSTPIFTVLMHDENDFIASYLDEGIEEANGLNPILRYQSSKMIQLFFQTVGAQTELLLMDATGRLSRHHYTSDIATLLPDNLLQFFTAAFPHLPVQCYQSDNTTADHIIRPLAIEALQTGYTAEFDRSRLTLTLHYQTRHFTGRLSDLDFDHQLSTWLTQNHFSADYLLLDSLVIHSEEYRPSELLTLKMRIETRLNRILQSAKLVYSVSRSL